MDIDLLSKMVKELILDNDVVMLPGLGSFMADVVPASFSDKGYTINPPYRRLSFRPNKDGDDRLAGFYAKANNIDKASADRIIRDFLDEMKVVLKEKKTIVFPGLGRLRATRENNYFFVPDENLDIYPDGFGFESVSLKTHEETPAEVSAVVAGLESLIPMPGSSSSQDIGTEEGHTEEEPAADELGETVVAPPEISILPKEEEPAPAEEFATEDSEAVAIDSAIEFKAEPESVARKRPAWKVVLDIVLIVFGAAILALAVFIVLAHVTPDFIDSILYTPEELRIINY